MDTTSGRWKDTGGRGIVPLHRPEASTSQERTSFTEQVGSHTSISPASGGVNTDATRYQHSRKLFFWRNFSLRKSLDRLLRKTVKRDEWIYVTVGLKTLIIATRSLPVVISRTKTVCFLTPGQSRSRINALKYSQHLYWYQGYELELSVLVLVLSGLYHSHGNVPAFIIPWRWPRYLCGVDICKKRCHTYAFATLGTLQVRGCQYITIESHSNSTSRTSIQVGHSPCS